MPDCFLNLHSPTHYHHESAILILVSVSSDHPQHWFLFHVIMCFLLLLQDIMHT